jgi:hypothetical protein
LPITEIPYSRDGIPTMGIVQPLEGIHWIPTGTGNLSPGQHLQQQPGAVNMVTEECQSSGKGYFRGWIGQKPYLRLHDSGSPWTFHTSGFRKSLSPTSSSYICTRRLRLRGFFDAESMEKEVAVYEFKVLLEKRGEGILSTLPRAPRWVL